MKQIKFYLVLFAILFANQNLFSQYMNISFNVVGYYHPNEPTIMINPKNTNQVVAGTNYYYAGADTALSRYYYSTNGGLNWQNALLFSTKAKTGGDPVVIVDTNGAFYFITLTNFNRNDWLDNLLCLKSTNGGANWDNGTLFGYNNGKDMDKPWGCVDLTHGIYGNNIYVTWTEFDKFGSHLTTDSTHILFSRSSDNGTTFSVPKRINSQSGNCVDSTNTVEGAVPCVGISGEIYVVWAGWTNLYFNKSTNGGNTWLPSERIIGQQVGGWIGVGTGKATFNGLPIAACDISNGPYRGNVYVNWVDQRNGLSDQDVWVMKSTNGGDNWNQPVKVSTDTSHRNQFLTWMTIDQKTGYIYCVYYDRRNSPTYLTDIYVARSTNGGNSFQDVKVNSSTINMSSSKVGDYIGITAYNNKVRPVWIHSVNYNNSIFTAIIDSFYTIGINLISNELPESYSLKQNFPNPFNPSTNIKFDLPKTSFVSIKIYDVSGREVETIVNEKLQAGKYEAQWNGISYSSGVYFYKLMTEGFTDTKRMILVK